MSSSRRSGVSRRPWQAVVAAGGGKPDRDSIWACGVAGFAGSGLRELVRLRLKYKHS